ncbi:hypothetical protein EVG20_g2921 [Dentipellis fragilis]|uniref:Uncharacterized protein n=1 Tax=Dentipellis fragilis TaxID=205917 RepID=A0A4Y9Z995_9AGAM|nr:hypothetical protein EVG20_g2921 [Dentipellis fragilis]
MPSYKHIWVPLVFSLASQYVYADTSLWIPGFDPQPLSVVILGADANQHTTWEILPGSLTGTFSQPTFIGTAIMIQGPQDAHVTWQGDGDLAGQSFEITCSVTGIVADCTAPNGYFTTPYVFPQTVEPFIVQGGQYAATSAPPVVQTSAAQATSAAPPQPSVTSALPAPTSAPPASSASSVSSPSAAPSSSNTGSATTQPPGTTPIPSASLITSPNAASASHAHPALAFGLAVLCLITVL